jgi:hypothetical protein
VRELSLVLDGKPNSLAREPERRKRFGCYFCLRLEPGGHQPNNTPLAAGLRFNEPLPVNFHNTMSLGYMRNSLSPQFLPPSVSAWKTEQGVEFNALLDVAPMLLLQPVIQYYANVGGGVQRGCFWIENQSGVLTMFCSHAKEWAFAGAASSTRTPHLSLYLNCSRIRNFQRKCIHGSTDHN